MKTSLLFGYLQLKTNLLEHLSETPNDLLNFRPNVTSWSILQVCEHLMKIENEVFISFQKQTEKAVSYRRYQWKSVWKFALLKLALISRLKFNAPSPRVIPDSEKTFEEIKIEWLELSSHWKNFQEILAFENGTIFRHPATGWLTANQTFQFMIDHLKHHQQQIKNNHRLYHQVKSKT